VSLLLLVLPLLLPTALEHVHPAPTWYAVSKHVM
jgi:hypothetical protein